MSDAVCAKLLIFFGSMVLLAGVSSGIGLWRAFIRNSGIETLAAWSAAVVLPSLMGTLMLAMTAVRPRIYMGEVPDTILVWSLAASGTALAMSWPVAAITGQYGFRSGGSFANRYVFGGNITGLAGAIVGSCIIVTGAVKSAMELL